MFTPGYAAIPALFNFLQPAITTGRKRELAEVRPTLAPLPKCCNRANHGNNINNINLLTPNVNYSGRTAPLTSKVAFYIFIQQI